jgi:hypothetical protein
LGARIIDGLCSSCLSRSRYGYKCFYCREPLRWDALQVDHVVPEYLAKEPQQRARVFRDLGLADDRIWPIIKPSRAMSRCSSAKTFGGSGMPSGVCTVARRSAAWRQGWFEVANAQPGQGSLDPVVDARAFSHQGLALPVRPFGVLFGNRRHAHHVAMAPFATQPPREPALQQLGVEPVDFRPAMSPRYRDTRGWITCASTPRASSQRRRGRLRRQLQSA